MKEELFEFIQTEKNVAMDFVKRAKAYQGDIYLYGAGSHLKYVVRFMERYQIPVKAILDSSKSGKYCGNPNKGSHNGDIPIIKFEDFLKEKERADSSWFFISAPSAAAGIKETIASRFPEENIFFFETFLYADFYADPLSDVDLYRQYLLGHREEISQLLKELADDMSRETLVSVLKGRISGRLEYFRQCCVPDKYHPKDIVHFSPNEVMVELGGADGHTLLEFIQCCPDYRTIYCFEPDRACLSALKRLQESRGKAAGPIHVIPKGAWDCAAVLKLSEGDTAAETTRVLDPAENAPGYEIELAAVDDEIKEPITYLEMDVEGAELKALHGAEDQIKRYHPKLTVCVYHRNEDLLEIWSYLRKLVPSYRFYLRHHCITGGETVLYAVAED